MRRWLLHSDEPVEVISFDQFPILKESELLCTPHGQTLRLPKQRSVYDLNAEVASTLRPVREQHWQSLSDDERRQLVAKTLDLPKLLENTERPESFPAGKVVRDGYHIDKLVMRTRHGTLLPALTFHPPDPDASVDLYLHDSGKIGDGEIGGAIEKRLLDGRVVVTVDLRGQGETASGTPDPKLGDWKTFYTSYLLGKSTVAAHTEDIVDAALWCAYYQRETPRPVHLYATGRVSIAALHAAALRPDIITSLHLAETPKSWSETAGSPELAQHITTTVHGVLRHYDLPDLLRLTRPQASDER